MQGNFFSLRFITIIFFISLGIITPFNVSGWLPVSLIVSFILAISVVGRLSFSKLKVPTFSIIDFLIGSFLLNSVLSVVFNFDNSANLNLNHVLAHFVVLISYYFIPRIGLYNVKNQSIIYYIYLVSLAFWFITLSGIIDYILLIVGINWAEIIPSNAAPVAGSLLFQRARGFFVEPTDFGLGLNACAPVLLVWFYNIRKTKMFFTALTLYFISLLLCRSSSAMVGAFAGLIVAVLFFILSKKFTITRYALRIFVGFSIAIIIVLLYFQSYLVDVSLDILYKVTFQNQNSGANRLNSWLSVYETFVEKGNWMFGNGTGFTTGNQGEGGTLNWYVTVLIENGIMGVTILALIIIFTLLKLFQMKSFVKYGLIISFVAVTVHLFTQTGFYMPFLWIILVLSQLNWNKQAKSTYI